MGYEGEGVKGESRLPGDPSSGPPKVNGKPVDEPTVQLPPVERVADMPSFAGREYGINSQPPSDFKTVSASDDLFSRDEPGEEAEFEAALLEMTGGFTIWGMLSRKAGTWPAIVLICSAIALFLLAQIVTLVSQLQALPVMVRVGGYFLLALLLAGIGWAVWKLLMVFVRAATTPRVPVQALASLAERARLRKLANARLEQAVRTLRKLMAEHSLEGDSKGAELLRKHLTEDEFHALRMNARELQSVEVTSVAAWLDDYEARYLGYLDKAAAARIKLYSLRVGIKTGALPSGFDTPVVLLNAYMLAGDLCAIYNLRTSRAGTAAVLARVFVNAFAASQMDEITESLAEQFIEGAGVAAGALRTISAKLGESSANYLLFRRLGLAMVRHLRPVRKE